MTRTTRFAKSAIRHPVEAVYRVAGGLEDRQADSESRAAVGAYRPAADWLARLHREMNVTACQEEEGFREVWADLQATAGGLRVDSHDSDRAFANALWCAVRHMGATKVVETGVARGVSSRFVLEALADRPGGHLWSVDLPLLSNDWAQLAGTAIPTRLRNHWTYLRGPSRRLLPKLFRSIGQVDVFVQDSRGTTRTAGYEFQAAWKMLRPGGMLVANSVDRSLAFARLVDQAIPSFALTASFNRKPGVFGLARKN
jgi:hypothetical protein